MAGRIEKTYLGDGVYIDATPDGLVALSTENGISVTNVIYLEPEVIAALLRVLRAWNALPRDASH